MQTNHKIVWTKTAKNDLKEIKSYIALDIKKIAFEKLDLIESKVKSLDTNPEIRRKIPELEDYTNFQYRELIISPWRVIYEYSQGTVHVLMVLDGRRNLQDILFKRLMKS